MDKNNPLVHVEDIYFGYPGQAPVLKGLSFSLREGERIGLIGPNGSGKTTFFMVLMGLLRPQQGEITIFGKRMRDQNDFRSVRHKIGLLFQDPDDQLFSPTVIEDVAFGPLNLGYSVAEARTIANETLKSLGLQDLKERVTYKLSGGEKRLVSLATVLAMNPRVLLFDEPIAGLDPDTTQKIIELIKGLRQAYVFISHNMDFIARATDKVYGLLNGTITHEEMVPHSHLHAHGFGGLPHSHEDAFLKGVEES